MQVNDRFRNNQNLIQPLNECLQSMDSTCMNSIIRGQCHQSEYQLLHQNVDRYFLLRHVSTCCAAISNSFIACSRTVRVHAGSTVNRKAIDIGAMKSRFSLWIFVCQICNKIRRVIAESRTRFSILIAWPAICHPIPQAFSGFHSYIYMYFVYLEFLDQAIHIATETTYISSISYRQFLSIFCSGRQCSSRRLHCMHR